MKREKFPTRTIRLVGELQKQTAETLLNNVPLDSERPLELLIREEVKPRKLDQNALYWAGPLKCIAEQAYVGGRTYNEDLWHEFFKREYLPEDNDPDIAELVKEGYRKWDIDPKGRRILIGSTTQLTVKGFARYMTGVEAYGAGLGVVFTEHRRAA